MSEHRALKRERVVLAVLTAGIDPSGGYLVHEAFVDGAPEPRRMQPGQIHASDDSPASRLDELAHQLGRRLTPDRLDVLQPGGRHAVLIPGADVSKVDVAEHDAPETLRAKFGKLVGKPGLHVGPTCADG